MKRQIFVAILSFLSFFSYADNWPTGANSAGMAHSTVMLPGLWSIHHNQAGLANIQGITFGAFFENRYFINELGLKSAAVALPTGAGTFGLNVSHFGYSKYNEVKAGLAYAIALGKKVSAGIQIDYFNIHQDESYGNIGKAVGEIGIQANPISGLFIGAHLFNPWRTQITENQNERIPTVFRMGLGYDFAKKVMITAEFEKDLDIKPVFKAGIEYNMVSELYLRTGIATNPVYYTFGVGYAYTGAKLDLAFSRDPILGYISSVSLQYSFTKSKKMAEN